ncbi:four-carbon acid sugar kinase family protein [Telmatospirillum sp.]|uniref:four-carbon acid sugar kinase family protein n=1 Tax=Telmatospirillum sp. TaxID=2079197 RepID=UPI0028459E62|nr:four-carbon acid sugar kinase family protein [Telmatospirillum sp.]MDR3438379.1 four-carbon acid sugar kinase family protein [Telmatospirillum sp.]
MGTTMEATQELVLTFYGDDFTGSTDAMEALTMAGIPTVLFLAPPTPADMTRYPGVKAVGVAGTSRSRSPQWMDAELPEVFRRLKALGAPFCHYKTCSTFDSAPTIGSIGRAAEIGEDVFGAPVIIVVGVARHQRYVMFSNLFASASFSGGDQIFRIDRHPTMSRHPVTPMAEADLRCHLAAQTGRRVVGFDFRRMLAGNAAQALDQEFADGADMVILDTFDAATTLAAGRLIAHHGRTGQRFLAGSSGIEYALAEHLTAAGRLPFAPPPGPRGAADKLLVLCGSCSPITAEQIAWAEQHGYALIALDTEKLVESRGGQAEHDALKAEAIRALSSHAGVVLHSARGPGDPRLAPTRAALGRLGLSTEDSSRVLGGFLGRVVRDLLADCPVSRILLAGGDSSSYAAEAMGIEALDVAGPLLPGAPLCRIHAPDPAINGVEVVLKGGQAGGPDAFGRVLAGR